MRPVLRKVATLEEIETHYSLYDLLDIHEALDVQEDAEAYYAKKARQDAKR